MCVCVPSSGFGRSPPLSIFFMRFFCFLLVPQTWRWGNLQNAGTRWVPFMLCYRQQKDLHKKGIVRLSSWGSNSNVTQARICVQIYIYIKIKWNTSKNIIIIIEWCLEVKLPTIWTDEKQRWEESEKRIEEERRSKKRQSEEIRFRCAKR